MHELGMCQAVVEAVTARAGARPVDEVRVRVGVLHRVEPGAFEQAFALAAEGTAAAGAAVRVVPVPARFTCPACGAGGETSDPLALCPACGAAGPALEGGDDLTLESLRYAPEGGG